MPRNQQYEMQDMSGVLFKNEDKDPENEAHDKWADYRGRIKIEGVEYWLSAWIRKGRDSGKVYMSLAVNDMDQSSAPPRRRQGNGRPAPRQQSTRPSGQQQRSRPQRDPDLDAEPDDIPFRSSIHKDVRNSRLNRNVL
jgi:hypothetical protein